MSLASVSIKRPVLATVMSLAIVLFGIIGFLQLGVREYPAIDPPVINVRTNYTGANAEVIESQITEPLEKAINGIAGIRTISSSSNQGSSQITVEFNLGEDLEAAANDVRDKVSQAVRQLPQDIDAPPVVSKADANSDAILTLTVQSTTRNHLQVSDYAENVIAERLQTIPGVSTIQIWGLKRYAMRVWMDPARLAAYGLTPVDVQQALNRENVELPTGKIAGNATELTVRAAGKLTNEEEFNNLIIAERDGHRVLLRDIGHAVLGPENEESILRGNGIPMIGLAIVPQPGSNYVAIADEFYARYDQIKKDLPGDFITNIAMDNTRFIRKSITEVQETLMIALVLVILVIFAFFRDWRLSLRPLIDIPVSLIGAFFIMYLMGYSINILTLLAIVLATGLVVDDGIVVTENIYKKVEAGMNPREAAFKGSSEIFFAVVSTTVTLAAVFLPIIFLEGFVGRLFQEFGVVLASAVIISMFVALSLTPMLNSIMLKKNQKHSAFYEKTEPFFQGMTDAYAAYLSGFMKRRWLAFVIIGVAGGLIWLINNHLQSELAPLEDRSMLRVSVTAPEGASYEYTDAFMMRVVQFIMDSVPENAMVLSVTAPGFTGSGAVNTGFIRLRLVEPHERERSQQQIADYLNRHLARFNEARAFVLQEQTIAVGGAGRSGFPVQYVLQAQNFEKLREALPRFMEAAAQHPTLQGVDVNLKFNKPELVVNIDRDRATALGVSVQDIGTTLQLALSGSRFSYFFMNGKQYQVIGQLSREHRDQPLALTSLYVKNSRGELIQMDNVVQVSERSSPPQLYHYNRYVSATVSAGLAPGATIGDGIRAMDEIAAQTLDASFSTALSGPSRDYDESSSNIMFAFLLALLLIYLVLAAQFESFIDPFIIMITVPLALVGAFIALWYFNQTLNIFSQIGIIMLIGLVTKNGILIVEFANQRKAAGMTKLDAVTEAATARLRPILMTTLATMFGAVPIAIAFGGAATSRMALGIVVIGGLLFALVLTLFVIPAMYSYLSRDVKPVTHTGASRDDSKPLDPVPA